MSPETAVEARLNALDEKVRDLWTLVNAIRDKLERLPPWGTVVVALLTGTITALATALVGLLWS